MLPRLLPTAGLIRAVFRPQTLAVQPPYRTYAVSSARLAMPPKATASKRGKRKVESTSPQPAASAQEPVEEAVETKEEVEDEEEDKPKKAKRAKKAKEPVKPIDPSVPTNLTVPDNLEPFPRPPEGCIRISAWNVAGLRAGEKKGAPLPAVSSPANLSIDFPSD